MRRSQRSSAGMSGVDWIRNKLPQSWNHLEFKPTLLLVATSLLLTVYRYYGRRQFLRGLLGGHFSGISFAPLLPFFAWYLGAAIPLLLIPVLLIRGAFRESLRAYGFQMGNARWGLGFVGIAYVLMLPILGIAAQLPGFQHKYPLFKRYYDITQLAFGTRWTLILLYELAYGIYFISWEFFFRGFMLYGLEPYFGTYTVFVQTIPFAIMHYGKPFPEALGSIFTGILLGFVGLHTRSFYYAFLVHWLVALTMDLISLG